MNVAPRGNLEAGFCSNWKQRQMVILENLKKKKAGTSALTRVLYNSYK